MNTSRISTLFILALCCVAASNAGIVQANNASGSGTTVSVALGASVTAGNAIIICTQSTVGQAISISDSLGNGYAPIPFSAGFKMWYAINSPAGSNTITAHFSSSATWSEIIVSEFPAAETNGGIDQIVYSSGSGTSPSIPITTTAANELIIGYLAGAQGTADYVTPANQIAGGDPVGYQYQNTAGSTSVDFTQSGSSWSGVAVSFKPPLSRAEQIYNDMIGTHEDNPQGVPSYYGWYSTPIWGDPDPSGDTKDPMTTTCSTTYPCPWVASTAWGVIYPGSAGNTSTNTQVNIRNMQLYVKFGGTWYPLQNSINGISNIGFQESPEDFVNGTTYTTQTGVVTTPGDGTIAAIAGECFPMGTLSTSCSGNTLYNFHFWPSVRGVYTPPNQGVIACLEARLILIDSGGTDDRATSNYLVEGGADWWPTATSGIPPAYTQGTPPVANGKLKFAQANWRSYCSTNLSLSDLQLSLPTELSFTGILP